MERKGPELAIQFQGGAAASPCSPFCTPMSPHIYGKFYKLIKTYWLNLATQSVSSVGNLTLSSDKSQRKSLQTRKKFFLNKQIYEIIEIL